jgi:hypothetical protein
VGKAKSNEKVLKMSVKYRAKGLKYHKPIVNTISIKATINHATARRISATSTASPFRNLYEQINSLHYEFGCGNRLQRDNDPDTYGRLHGGVNCSARQPVAISSSTRIAHCPHATTNPADGQR